MRLFGDHSRNATMTAVVAAVLILAAQVPAARAEAPAAMPTVAATEVPVNQNVSAANPVEPKKSLTGKAIDKVKQVAKSAGDIFSRVPCLAPRGGMKAMGALPHVAGKLAAGQPVVIIAFGSSSTEGYGSTAPEFTYPNRLAAQLRRTYPTADITVLNRGKGGEDAPEMMTRLQNDVINLKPDLVIWQVGTNAVLRNLDPTETAKEIEEGVSRIQAGGADLVLVDPQYSPAVNAKPENAGKMIGLLKKIAELRPTVSSSPMACT
jgi:lysophospholipase L1-like esterase